MKNKDFLQEGAWRDSARSVRFFIWDVQAVYAFLLFVIYIRLWTFLLALAVMMFLTILNRYGFSPKVFLRWMRTTIAGSRKVANPWWIE